MQGHQPQSSLNLVFKEFEHFRTNATRKVEHVQKSLTDGQCIHVMDVDVKAAEDDRTTTTGLESARVNDRADPSQVRVTRVCSRSPYSRQYQLGKH